MSNNKIHDEHTRQISIKPQLIGLDGIVLSTEEAHIRNSKGEIFSEPDGLAFDPTTKTLYNIEYKCHDNNNQYRHAETQLVRSALKLKQIFKDWSIVNLYVHDNYKAERMR